MLDPATGALVVTGTVKRLSKAEAELIRQAQAAGQVVVFKDRHQWRHFQRYA